MGIASLLFWGFLADLSSVLAATLLWAWFISEPFGLPTINVLHVWGLRLLVSVLFADGTTDTIKDKNQQNFNELIIRKIVTSSLVVLFGFIFHYFMV